MSPTGKQFIKKNECRWKNIHNAFNGKFEKIYKVIFKKHLERLPLSIDAKDVVYTLNEDRQSTYFIAVNHSETEKELNLNLNGNYEIESVIYGSKETVKPYDAVILKLKKHKQTN